MAVVTPPVVSHLMPGAPDMLMIACAECGMWHRRTVGAYDALTFRCGHGRSLPTAARPELFHAAWTVRLYGRDNMWVLCAADRRSSRRSDLPDSWR